MRSRVRDCLPAEAATFYDAWAPPAKTQNTSVFTFEFWKTLLASVDQEAARQAYYAEIFVRLAAHTCYALFWCILMLACAIPFAVLDPQESWRLLVFLLLGDLTLLAIVLYNLRFLRVGEVEHVFASCFNHRAALLDRLRDADRATIIMDHKEVKGIAAANAPRASEVHADEEKSNAATAAS
jgi:hypothetical protein